MFVRRELEDLPELDEASEAHMQLVWDSLRALIQSQDNFIGFDEYMTHALYEPGLGYYSAGAEKFGEAGDYVTAPVISSLFSQTLARFMGQHLPVGGSILELGAGTGILAADMLAALAEEDRLPVHYHILELSADLRERQRQTLEQKVPQLMSRVKWQDRLDSSNGFRGIMFGNEVVDALPVKRFVLRNHDVYELGVGIQDDLLCWLERSADLNLKSEVIQRLPVPMQFYPENYVSEINLPLQAWVGRLAEYMREGLILFLDYGFDRKTYYQPDRVQGTLRTYHRHHALDDPFYRPGLADITAWVDFTALAEAADLYGLSIDGYTTQASFLLENGLTEIMQSFDSDDENGRMRVAQEVKRLTLPSEMGETVKVMALSKNSTVHARFHQDLLYCL